ncbi:helix-turn-helix transcriptional regulator [Sorangium sp. So ce134]
MRPSEARRLAVTAYVAARLERECSVRGTAAQIARATNFSKATISAIISGRGNVGEDFAHKIAEYWGMSYAQLQREAEAWQDTPEGKAAPERAQPWRRLKDRPEWAAAIQAARAFYADIPPEYFDRVGKIFDDVTRRIDAQFVGEMARVIWSTEQRESAVPPASVIASTVRGHVTDKKSSKS